MDIRDALKMVLRQADRYLIAAQQDSDEAIGLVHASYSMVGYTLLQTTVPCLDRVTAAAQQQVRWGARIRNQFGRGIETLSADIAPLAIPSVTSLTSLPTVAMQHADAHLRRAQQNTDETGGLVHASYAMAGYEMLLMARVPCQSRIKAAAEQQERWGAAIRQQFGRGTVPSGVSERVPGLSGGLATDIFPALPFIHGNDGC